jgi:hypothetical protein
VHRSFSLQAKRSETEEKFFRLKAKKIRIFFFRNIEMRRKQNKPKLAKRIERGSEKSKKTK